MLFNIQLCNPDMVIGSKNKMKGDIKFEGTLRIDGSLEGNIIAPIEVPLHVLLSFAWDSHSLHHFLYKLFISVESYHITHGVLHRRLNRVEWCIH